MAKPGAPPKFREAHVNWAFWKIAKNQPMGRKALVSETGLGEGSLRTILGKLEEYGLVRSVRAGRMLTENGSKVFKRLSGLMRIESIGSLNMTGKPHNCLVLVREAGRKVKSGMEQRDEAIRIGRGGATTLVVDGEKLIIPGFDEKTDLSEAYPDEAERIMKLLRPSDGDAAVIGSEDTLQAAEEAAEVAASTLLS